MAMLVGYTRVQTLEAETREGTVTGGAEWWNVRQRAVWCDVNDI